MLIGDIVGIMNEQLYKILYDDNREQWKRSINYKTKAYLDSYSKVVPRILGFLAGTLDYDSHITRSNKKIATFSNSVWALALDESRSMTKYCVYYGSNMISWCAK